VHSPTHLSSLPFPVDDDCLVVGGLRLPQLAERIGGTPFYAYDRQLIAARIGVLRRALPEAIHLHYAVKANPMPALVQFIAPMVDGMDVASGGEMTLALNAGVRSNTISLAGPGKRLNEISRAIAAGVVISIESENELETIGVVASATGIHPLVAIRVNPDFELKTSGMKMSGGPKPFGVDAERVPAMLARVAKLPVTFYGFHIYTGSQNLRAEAIQEAQDQVFSLAVELARHAPTPVRLLNIGGGFGIPYFPGDRPLDLQSIGKHLQRKLPQVQKNMSDAQIVIELGRYIVGEAGVYVCRIVDRKVSRGQIFLVTDGGMHHHLAASGNFGQVVRKNYPIVVGNKVYGQRRETASIVGPLCTPLDLLGDRMDLAEAAVGDLVAILHSGAYGLSASPLAFLSHPAPAEVLV